MLSKLICVSFIMLAGNAMHAMEQEQPLNAHETQEIAYHIVTMYQNFQSATFKRLVLSSPDVVKDANNYILYRCITSFENIACDISSLAFLIKQGAPLKLQQNQSVELEKIAAKKKQIETTLSCLTKVVKGQQNKEAIENYSLIYNTLASATNTDL